MEYNVVCYIQGYPVLVCHYKSLAWARKCAQRCKDSGAYHAINIWKYAADSSEGYEIIL